MLLDYLILQSNLIFSVIIDMENNTQTITLPAGNYSNGTPFPSVTYTEEPIKFPPIQENSISSDSSTDS